MARNRVIMNRLSAYPIEVQVKLYKKITQAFRNINARCKQPNREDYKNYGGRGIKVLWQKRKDFLIDMQETFFDAYDLYGFEFSIDRIDSNSNYSKDNCRWTDKKTQNINKRPEVSAKGRIKLRGSYKSIDEWLGVFGISKELYKLRIEKGMSVKQALLTPRDRFITDLQVTR